MQRRSGSRERDLRALSVAVPWLALLPLRIALRLDLAEFVLPVGRVAQVRTDVEHALGAYVMTYRRDAPTPARERIQLCQILRCADLSTDGMSTLRRSEAAVKDAGVLLCAYASPLSLCGPSVVSNDGQP